MAAHNVLRIRGNLPGGEVWSVTPKFTGNFGDLITGYADLLEWLTTIQGFNAGRILPDPIMSILSSSASVTGLRGEYINDAGDLTEVAEVGTLGGVPEPGTGTATKPFQTAVVASLRTGRPGRSYRGRIYWPGLSAGINSTTLRLEPGTASGIASATADFLTAVQEAAPAPSAIFLAVVSQTLDTNAGVTSIQVGNVLDVQRRRRDQAVEVYSSEDFPS